MTQHELIAGSYRMAKGLLHRMVDDLTPGDFRHVPCPGANSAAWIVGHLATVLRNTAARLSVTDLPTIPDGFAERFTANGKFATEQDNLGEPAELVRLFDACIEKVIAAIPSVSPEVMAGPPARPGLATTFAEAMVFGTQHIAMHTGQLSTIRRSLGKPPVV